MTIHFSLHFAHELLGFLAVRLILVHLVFEALHHTLLGSIGDLGLDLNLLTVVLNGRGVRGGLLLGHLLRFLLQLHLVDHLSHAGVIQFRAVPAV